MAQNKVMDGKQESSGNKMDLDTFDMTMQQFFDCLANNRSEAFKALKKFSSSCKSSSDIVKSYLDVSCDGEEILKFLEGSKHSASEYVVIFEVIESVLLTLAADDLDISKLKHIGLTIVRRILRSSLRTIYHLLNEKNKAHVIKSAFKLLTSMVTVSTHAAREVATVFEFTHITSHTFINRRDIKDPQDIRACVVYFMCAFLMSEDNNVIKRACQVKGLINGVFPGLISDKCSVIQVFLSTLQSRVLENPNITKTLKVKLFNDFTLVQIMALYKWIGPKRAKYLDKKNSSETPTETASDEEKLIVHQTVHKFMIVTLSSHKHGIIFIDETYGTSGKNMNHIVSNVLKSFEKPHDNALIMELVVKVLTACPDQVKFYLESAKTHISNPRASPNWLKPMEFIHQVLTIRNAIKIEYESTLRPAKMAEIIVSLTLPSQIFTKEFTSLCLNHDCLDVKMIMIEMLLSALKTMTVIFTKVKNSDILGLAKKSLVENLPSVATFMSCWQQCNEVNTEKERESSDSRSGTLVKIVEILSICQMLLANDFISASDDFSTLLVTVNESRKRFEESNWRRLYVKILNLIIDGQNFEALLSSSVLSILTETYLFEIGEISNSAVNVLQSIVKKSLQNLDTDEILIWLQGLKEAKSKSELTNFFIKVIMQSADVVSTSGNSNETDSSTKFLETAFGLLKQKKYSKKAYFSFVSDVIVSLIHFRPDPTEFCVYIENYLNCITKELQLYLKVWTKGFSNIIDSQVRNLDSSVMLSKQLRQILLSRSEAFSSIIPHIDNFLCSSDEQHFLEVAHQISLYILVLQTCNDSRLKTLLDFLDQLFKSSSSKFQDIMYPVILKKKLIKDAFLDEFSAESDRIRHSVLNIFNCCSVNDVQILSLYSSRLKQFVISRLASSMQIDYASVNNLLKGFVVYFDANACLEIINLSNAENLVKIDPAVLAKLVTKCTEVIRNDKVPRLSSCFVKTFANFVCESDRNESRFVLLTLLRALPIYASIVPEGTLVDLLPGNTLTDVDICSHLVGHSTLHHAGFKFWILNEIETSTHCPHHLYGLIDTFLKNTNIEDANQVNSIFDALWPSCKCLLIGATSVDGNLQHLVEIISEFLRLNLISKKKKSRMQKKITDYISHGNTIRNDVLVVYKGFFQDNPNQLLNILFATLSSLSPRSDPRKFSETLLSILQDLPGNTALSFQESLLENFTKLSLKNGMKYHEQDLNLLKVLTYLYKYENVDGLVPMEMVYTLVLSHSKFLSIMFDTAAEQLPQKESVIDLMLCLVTINNSVCSDKHIPIFLGAYSVTFSAVDQKLLRLLYLYENSVSINFYQYRPYIWGQKAISHYSVLKNIAMALVKQTKMEDVLEQLDTKLLVESATKFPLRLPLCVEGDGPAEVPSEEQHLYDPRFLFPLFSNLLAPENFVHFPKFIETGCLSYTFASLSSYNASMRSAGYHLLELFYMHLDGARKFRNRKVFLLVLDVLRNGIEKQNARVPHIISLFFSKLCLILYHPDVMYLPLRNYITIHPAFNINHIPEYFKLFFSEHTDCYRHRSWLLQLLAEGVNTDLDFYVCERRHTFRTLLSYYFITTYDQKTKVLTLDIILSACKSVTAVIKFIRQYQIVGWIQQIVMDRKTSFIERKMCYKILSHLWETLLLPETNERTVRNKNRKKVEPTEKNSDIESGSGEMELDHNADSATEVKEWINVNNHLKALVFAILAKVREIDSEDLNSLFSLLHSLLRYNCCEEDILQDFVSSWIDTTKAICHSAKTEAQTDQAVFRPELVNSNDALLIKVIQYWTPDINISGSANVILKVASFLLETCCAVTLVSGMMSWLRRNLKSANVVNLLISNDENMKMIFHGLLNLRWKKDLEVEVFKLITDVFAVASTMSDDIQDSSLLKSIMSVNAEKMEIFISQGDSGKFNGELFEELIRVILGCNEGSTLKKSNKCKRKSSLQNDIGAKRNRSFLN